MQPTYCDNPDCDGRCGMLHDNAPKPSRRAHVHMVVKHEPEGAPYGGEWAVYAQARTRREHLGYWRDETAARTFASVYPKPELNPKCKLCKGGK